MGKKKRQREQAAVSSTQETFDDFPLTDNSEELRALLSGWINVGTRDGLPNVNEHTAMGIPAFARGVELIAGTIAGLPLKTYSGTGANRQEVPSLFDDPTGPYEISPFNWVEMIVLHLIMYKEAYLIELRNNAGALVGYYPTHPINVTKVEWNGPDKVYHVAEAHGGTTIYGTPEVPTEKGGVLQILGPTTNGLRGSSIFWTNRRIFQIAIAAELASARTFTGALIGGLVTTAPDEDLGDDPEGEADLILQKLNAKMSGPDNAGKLAFVNRHLEFKNWQMSNLDAQFSESRAFQIEEFARLLGLPPHLLAQTDKQTSWGTGVSEQNLGLARYCLMGYTSRIEAALNTALPFPDFVEFDYKGLLQGTPKEEIELLLAEAGLTRGQQGIGLMTRDEARAVVNLPPAPEPVPIARAPGVPVQGE